MKEIHTCENCGINDENATKYRHKNEAYYDFTGVKFYDHNLPPTLEPGWYCNICLKLEKSSWWRQERNSYIYDNYGTTSDSDDFDWD